MEQIDTKLKSKSRSTITQTQTIVFLSLVPIVFYLYKVLQKRRHYRRLKIVQQRAIAEYAEQFQLTADDPQSERLSFAEPLAVIPQFLTDKSFQRLHDEIVELGQTERSYFPIHKQGGTVAYETLHEYAPRVVGFFHNEALRNFISQIVGEPVYPSPIHDQSACSLLFYTQPGDHINWHYDHNFYNGRHFTVLLPIVNQQNDTPEELSSAQLMTKQGQMEQVVSSAPNTLVLFEGAKVLHKVTRLAPNETRIMLSMTFVTTPNASLIKAMVRRIKDVAFFGIRALWT